MNIFLPKIYGFNKASEMGLDTFAPSIFLGGCNFRCPYCMNSKLANNTCELVVDLEEVKKFIIEEKSEWLMISGGEPTCLPLFNIMVLLGEILSWGCKIGMSTNGSKYLRLSQIINHLNYVALDIKASNKKGYEKLSTKDTYSDVLYSLQYIRRERSNRKDFNYELRTTLYPPLINKESLTEIGSNIINRDDKWVLQQFRHSQNMIDPSCIDIKPYSEEDVKSLIEIAKDFCDNVSLRYV